ncbi:MAG: hypothetical protein WCI67_06505 [Chloroflexales bacterium]
MNSRTARMFSAMVVAIMLMFVGDMAWNLSGGTIGSVEPATYPISLHQASIIAQDTAPSATLVGTPEIASYHGAVAYVITLDTGRIYVEATTGRILVNTVSTAAASGKTQD